MANDKKIHDSAPEFERQHIKDWPETERPREKLLQSGPDRMSDGELLAVLLRIGKSGQSAQDLGRQLLSQFNGTTGIETRNFNPAPLFHTGALSCPKKAFSDPECLLFM